MTDRVADFVDLCSTKLLWVNVALLVLVKVALPYSGMGLAAISDSVTTIDTEAIIRATNTARAVASLPGLAHNKTLDVAAQAKLDDMASRQYFAHVNPDGKRPWDWMAAQGYSYRAAGENLARGFSDPQAVVTAWMESPSHRANIVNTQYKDVGVASKRITLKGSSTLVVVQLMGAPSAAKVFPKPTSQKTAEASSQQLPQAVSTDTTIAPVQVPTLIPVPAGSLTASAVSAVSSYAAVWLTLILGLLVGAVAFVGMHRRLGWALAVHGALVILVATLPAVVAQQHLIF